MPTRHKQGVFSAKGAQCFLRRHYPNQVCGSRQPIVSSQPDDAQAPRMMNLLKVIAYFMMFGKHVYNICTLAAKLAAGQRHTVKPRSKARKGRHFR